MKFCSRNGTDCTDLAHRVGDLSAEQWGEARRTTLVGRSAAFVDAQHKLLHFAQAESPVLITGETGTGKELFARALFLLSARRRRPFIAVNCAQYQDGQLLASELFGHRRGSFTGAVADHRGVFEEANGGIVFLDEVGELSPSAQAMLLRVLGESEVIPVGETRARRVDVRILAATSRDLRAMQDAGRFRTDLYYRLRFLQICVPPVRDREGDCDLLLDHYLGRLNDGHAARKAFSADALATLRRHPWPGNVREVRGVVDAGFYSSEGELLIDAAHVVRDLETPVAASRALTRTGEWFGTTSLPVAAPAVRPGTATEPFATGIAADVDGDAVGARYARMRQAGESFWTVVHEPFMERELNRAECRAVVARGLGEAYGSYKRVVRLFNMPEEDYLKFMDFLRHHRLKPY